LTAESLPELLPVDPLPATDELVDGAVTVAYVHSNEVAYSWHHSLIELLGHDIASDGRLMRGGWIGIRCGTDGLPQSRNKAVKIFLDERDAEWLFWIDTDMGFEPDIIDRLVEAADPVKRPIVGALCFSNREDRADGLGGWRTRPTPTIFDWVKLDNEQMGFTIRWGYPGNTLVRCAGTGAAAVLVHRSVFVRMQEQYGPVWYDRVPNTSTGQLVSEDLSFCLRAGAMNIPVHVHTGVPTSHFKPIWLAETDYLRQMVPPPATGRTAIIVPAMRTTNVSRFMASARASSGLVSVYAVAGPREDVQAELWAQAGAQVLRGPGLTFAERMNFGYRNTDEPWIFVTGDDVRFRTGWLDQAQAVAGDRYDVVGTNDLGNPRVMAGEHATHLLVRRRYIDQIGASWDGPKILAHEGYRHMFVDDEIVQAAKDRDVWAMAIDSQVEHLHPAWGKGESDDIYAVGQESFDSDRDIYLMRVKANHAS